MKRWEYLRREVDVAYYSNFQEKLNELGKQGWELVNMTQSGVQFYFIFKREML